MNAETIASRRNLWIAGAIVLIVAVFATPLFGGPDLIGPLLFLAFLAGAVKLTAGPLSGFIARIRLSVRWKILGAISVMGALMVIVSLVNIGAMDYMHTELHEIQDLGRARPAAVLSAVNELESTQHGAFFSLAPLLSILGALVAFILGIAIAISVITPLRHMGEAMRRIASGDFSQPVEVRNRDELGELAERINDTARELERARADALASERARALRERIAHVTLTQEEERRRISRELHDGLGPSLAAIANRLRACQELIESNPRQAHQDLDDAAAALRGHVQEIRHLIYDLRPLAVDQLGLNGAIEQQVERFTKDTGISVVANVPTNMKLDPLAEVTVFRVVQECLSNIQKHANARNVELRVQSKRTGVEVSVRDDGRGFAANGADGATATEGVGLVSMRERADQVGGSLAVRSSLGHGCEVVLRLPPRSATLDGPSEEQVGAGSSTAG